MTILHTAYGFPTVGQNVAGAGVDWVSPTSIQADAGEASATATNGIIASFSVVDTDVNLIVSSVVGAENKASATTWPSSVTNVTYGGATDLWSETPSRADLYDANTGIRLIATITINGTPFITDALQALGWAWNPVIPVNATIVGIEALIGRRYTISGRTGQNVNALVRYIQLKAWYEIEDLNPHFMYP